MCKCSRNRPSDSSASSMISSDYMNLVLERAKCLKYRDSTKRIYQMVWRKFNKFLMRLDVKPKSWEERTSFFGAYLFDRGIQSSTLKSYVSAIKSTLIDDGYKWNNDLLLLGLLTKACKRVKDRYYTRLPIHKNLLENLLFELERIFAGQPFLEALFKAFFLISYYGMFRVGELATGNHLVKTKDVYIAENKD